MKHSEVFLDTKCSWWEAFQDTTGSNQLTLNIEKAFSNSLEEEDYGVRETNDKLNQIVTEAFRQAERTVTRNGDSKPSRNSKDPKESVNIIVRTTWEETAGSSNETYQQ